MNNAQSKNYNPELIEKGILPVCEVLNAIPGVSTVYSCEGHPRRPSPPYVSFKSGNEFALKVHKLLDTGSAGGKLKFLWMLTAAFDKDDEFMFTIESNDVRVLREPIKLFPFFSTARWDQNVMKRELLTLSDLLAELR